MWPEPKAAVVDGGRGTDEELGREGGGTREKERMREGEIKDEAPWLPPHWTTEKKEGVMSETRAAGQKEKREWQEQTPCHTQPNPDSPT